MKRIHCMTLILIVVSCLSAKAPSTRPSVTSQPAAPQRVRRNFSFLPPTGSGPGDDTRKIGGSRTEQSDIQLAVLAPAQEALTLVNSPSLFWFLSRPTTDRVEFAITAVHEIEPVLELVLDGSKPGVQRIDLQKHGLKLRTNQGYEWVVAVVQNADHRSRDIIASGVVQHIEPPSELAAQLASTTDPIGRAEALLTFPCTYSRTFWIGDQRQGTQGVWYDALAALSDEIDRDPANTSATELRKSLLESVGLSPGTLANSTNAGRH